MANKGSIYQVVGVFKDGKQIVSYQIQSITSDKTQSVDLEAFAFLVGQGRITNCSGQINNGTLVKRFSSDLKKIPILHINSGAITNADGSIKGKSAEDIMNMLNIVACVRSGKNIIAYLLENNAGAQTFIARNKVLSLAKDGRIANVRHQFNNDESILKGENGFKLRDLYTYILDDNGCIRNKDGVAVAKQSEILYTNI